VQSERILALILAVLVILVYDYGLLCGQIVIIHYNGWHTHGCI
jgi:hypothetical protein